jgi:hypothetical protein
MRLNKKKIIKFNKINKMKDVVPVLKDYSVDELYNN